MVLYIPNFMLDNNPNKPSHADTLADVLGKGLRTGNDSEARGVERHVFGLDRDAKRNAFEAMRAKQRDLFGQLRLNKIDQATYDAEVALLQSAWEASSADFDEQTAANQEAIQKGDYEVTSAARDPAKTEQLPLVRARLGMPPEKQ